MVHIHAFKSNLIKYIAYNGEIAQNISMHFLTEQQTDFESNYFFLFGMFLF